MFIFNIDTLRMNFIKPPPNSLGDGYLEVFIGEGEHWSFIMPGEDQTVISTTEKRRVSNLCSTGLYYFREKRLFDTAFIDAEDRDERINGEFYVAPLYNFLIKNGLTIKYGVISNNDIDFCGTPDDYYSLFARLNNKS